MAETFDPYHKWLGISPKDQPPHHYRLLGIELFESDSDVIESAADQRMSHVRRFQTGQSSALSQRILNELSEAKLCLLDPSSKSDYDRQLKSKLQPPKPPAAPRPLPQATPIPIEEPAPLVFDAPTSVARTRAARSTPLWRQPALLAGVGVAVLLAGAATYFLSAGSNREVVQAPPVDKPLLDRAAPDAAAPQAPQARRSPVRPAISPVKEQTSLQPPALTAASPNGELEIVEAKWGEGDAWADVTSRVKRLAKDRRLVMIVRPDLFGAPAAPDKASAKTLRIRYRARGRVYSAEYPDSFFVYLDGSPLAPPMESPGGLELLEARYGAGQSFLDVLPAARQRVRDDQFSATADAFYQQNVVPEGWEADAWANADKVLWVRYRTVSGEHFAYAWNKQTLTIDLRPPQTSGPAIDLLEQIDVQRDAVQGNWTLDGNGLAAPGGKDDRLQLTADVPEEYVLTVVVESDGELRDVSVGLPVGGRQVLASLDGYQGNASGLHMVNGASFNEPDKNPTSPPRSSRLLEQGRPNALTCIVRKNGLRVLRDGAELLRWSGDSQTFSLPRNWRVRDPQSLFLQCHDRPFRITKLTLAPLASESPTGLAMPAPQLAGAPVDVLANIDVKRDAVAGEWRRVDGMLVSPDSPFARLMLPEPPSPEYLLTVVAERVAGNWGLGGGLVVDGRQVMACIDGFDGRHAGLQLLDGKTCNDNESTVKGRLLTDGKPSTITYAVRRNGVKVALDGRTVIDWHGDTKRLSMTESWKIPDPARLSLNTSTTICRISKIEMAPLASESPAGPAAPPGLLKIFEDEPQFVSGLTLGDGTIERARDERYSGAASAKVSGRQRFVERLPGLEAKIRKQPQAPDEYRYLRFAWKKRGGEQIFLQFCHDGNWSRYSAGPYQGKGLGSSIRIANELPAKFVVVTRDLAADFGEFTLHGIALSPIDGNCAWFDHIYLARTLADFDPVPTAPDSGVAKTEDSPRMLGDLLSAGKSLSPPPDEAEQRKARQDFQKKFVAELAAAKSPYAKRELAEKFLTLADETEADNASVYMLLREAARLGEAASDFDLAWQAVDDLAERFAVDAVALKQQSLTEISKTARSPRQARQLTDDASRLMVAALAAGQPAAVKKIAAQAQSFAKRVRDAALLKAVGLRARDAGNWAAEFATVAAAQETLNTQPDDAKANFTLGRYEACAGGRWEDALPKLTQGSDENWRKAARDDLERNRNLATAVQKLAVGDAWWTLAENESWPAAHHLRMHAAEWYGRARASLAEKDKARVDERLRSLLAEDDGLPVWELFNIPSGQKRGGYVRLVRREDLRTPFDYPGAVDVTFEARTDGLNIRLDAHGHGAVIWNWEVNPRELKIVRPTGEDKGVKVTPLAANRWYEFHYVVTPSGMTVSVDGVPVFTERRDYAKIPPSPVGVHGAFQSVVDVRKLVVKPLK